MFFHDIVEYTFLQNALLAAVLAGLCCGIIGTIVVEKKLVMMSGGIAHTAFGGVGLGYLVGFEPIFGAMLFSLIASISIVNLERKAKTYSQIVIAVFWSMGMALGVVFISFLEGYPPDMTSYLFGDILAVSKIDIFIITILNIAILFITIALFNYIKAYIFDKEYLEVLKIKTKYLDYIIFILISFSTVVLIRIVGIILFISLLTVPAAIVRQFTNSLKQIMIYSALLASLVGISGIYISYKLNIASGAVIVILSSIIYLFTCYLKRNLS